MNIFGQEIKKFQGRGRRVVVQCNSHPEVIITIIITIIFLNKGWQSLFTVIVPQNHWSAKKPDQDDSTLKLLDKRAAGLRLHPLRFTHQMETSWSFFQAGCFSTSAHLQWMGQCLPGTFVLLKNWPLVISCQASIWPDIPPRGGCWEGRRWSQVHHHRGVCCHRDSSLGRWGSSGISSIKPPSRSSPPSAIFSQTFWSNLVFVFILPRFPFLLSASPLLSSSPPPHHHSPPPQKTTT